MDDKSKPADTTRRKLLRGAVAAPAMFTLPSGAALAATSLACTAKSASMQSSAKGLSDTSDVWVRKAIPVYSARFKPANGPAVEIKAIQLNSQWYYAYGTDAGKPILLELANGIGPTKTGSSVYGLVDYSKPSVATGTYGYFPADGSVSQPVAGASCWNSMPHIQAAKPGTNLLN